MSFFFGKKKPALSDASVDDIIEELRSRGITVNQQGNDITISATGKADVSNQVFSVLEAIEQWSKLERHRDDKDRNMIEIWSQFWAFDWERKPKGHCVDANKSVHVGLSEYSKYEDPNGSQILCIFHFDTERPGNYAKKDRNGKCHPVWGIAFSCEEMKALTKSVVENTSTKGTLIHREPEGDVDETDSWWQETHWLIEGGKITGIKVCIKLTQDKVHNTELIRFKTRGSTFEFIGKEEIKNNIGCANKLDIGLPEPEQTILPPLYHLNESSVSDTIDYGVISENSLLELKICSGESEAFNYDNDDYLCQEICSPVIMITNPTDSRIAIKEVSMEITQSSTEWVTCTPKIGTVYQGYYGREKNFSNQSSFDIEEHSSLELVFSGTIKIDKNGREAFNGAPFNRRIHPAFLNPLHCKIILNDDSNNMKRITFSHTNEPLEHLWDSYDGAVASGTDVEGCGPDYQEEMFICLENPLTLYKCMILVSTKRSGDEYWYVKQSNDTRYVSSSGSYLSPSTLTRLAYTASKEGKKEVDLDIADNKNCKLTGLVDLESMTIYALHGVVTITESNGNVIGRKEAFCRLDYSKVSSI